MRGVGVFQLLQNIGDYGRDRLTLQRRLFVFFLLFLVAIMSGLLLILFAMGFFKAGLKEGRIFLENELHHIEESVKNDFGFVSVQGVALSKRLTAKIESHLDEKNLKPYSFQNSPDCLEAILDDCVDILSASLEKNKVSAAFVVLNATVNPALEHAEASRAGVFIKNMLPNAVYESSSAIQYMRGPASIARKRKMYLLPQWQMEFAIEPGDFFHHAMDCAGNNASELLRLYRWNPKAVLREDYSEAMLLTLPLIASDGTVMGVCGFEISEMLFKIQYTPDNANFRRIFAMLAPLQEETIDASRALLAGNYTVTSAGIDGDLSIETDRDGFAHFTTQEGIVYSGLYQIIRLYPKDAMHGNIVWALCIVMPWQDLSDIMADQNQRVLVLLFVLSIASAAAAFLLSRRYISPIASALVQIKNRAAYSDYKKTNIYEIDDLIAFLSQQDQPGAQAARTESAQTGFTLFEAFVKSIETLSPAERSVFNLYMEGYNAKEIADILYLSINTIKTHNKRIYMKLNVSSRNELLVYVKMMKERNCSIEQ